MVIFLLPLAINSVHDLLNHEHTVCNSKVEKHVHEKDIDCKLHLLKENDVFLAESTFKLTINTIAKRDNCAKYNFLQNYQQLSFSLRGPPFYILA
ncbi:MAG: hypothetical protein ABF311_03205 [Polaribacter sp.]